MKKGFVFWIEEYFYTPNELQRFISFLLLPLSWVYCALIYLRYVFMREEDFGVAVVSVGNLNVGGNGKTPLVTELASRYEDTAVILRGYGRKSSGLYVIKDKEMILEDVDVSGDEAAIYANKLPHAVVIVSEDRKKAIHKAKEMGVKVIFLDDAYSKHNIKKLDLLIKVNCVNEACLPSGPFREKLWSSKQVYELQEDIDFKRIVDIKSQKDKMSLVTAIARASRLDKYLPSLVNKHYFEDHHSFSKDELLSILKADAVESLLVTYKDLVKIEHFSLPISLLDMHMEVDEKIFNIIDRYIEVNYAKEN